MDENLLKEILEKVIVWAEREQEFILRNGEALNNNLIMCAKQMGVRKPELVRILKVDMIKGPSEPQILELARQKGMDFNHLAGLTLGFGIYLNDTCAADLILNKHELRHVSQYEERGGIGGFMQVYLPQVLTFGYSNAPLEIEARKFSEK